MERGYATALPSSRAIPLTKPSQEHNCMRLTRKPELTFDRKMSEEAHEKMPWNSHLKISGSDGHNVNLLYLTQA